MNHLIFNGIAKMIVLGALGCCVILAINWALIGFKTGTKQKQNCIAECKNAGATHYTLEAYKSGCVCVFSIKGD